MQIEAFIIHLSRAEQRLPQVEGLRESLLPLSSHIIDAVDGQALSNVEIATVYERHLHRPRYPFKLRAGEIGCFLSHRKAWREIVERGLDAGLVVEDDVELDQEIFPTVFSFVTKNLTQGDFVRFPWRLRGDLGRKIAIGHDVTLIEPEHVGLGNQLQLVSQQAASALLEATERFDRPVDTHIQLDRVHGGRVLAVRPGAISHVGEFVGGTTIQKNFKPLTEVITREVRRLWYRARVR